MKRKLSWKFEFDNHSSPKVIVRLYGGHGVGGWQLTSIVNSIEFACFSQEMESLESLFEDEDIPEFRELTNAAHRQRWWYRRVPSLMITDARRGSILLEGVLIASVTWMLLNTVGETFKEAWKETDMHKKLKELFLLGRNRDVEKIAKNIENQLDRAHFRRRVIENKKVQVIEENGERIIQVEVKIIDELDVSEKQSFD